MEEVCKHLFIPMNKKAQTAGLVTGLVFGIATLIVGIIIAFVVVSTLNSAGLMDDTRTTTTVTNETNAWAHNGTIYPVDYITTEGFLTPVLTYVWMDWNSSFDPTNIPASTGYNVSVPITNFTLSNGGVLTNNSLNVGRYYANLTLTYTYVTKTAEEKASDRLASNFTSGVDNVSSKVPTILLVGAIVLILSILAVLVGVWMKMRSGGSSL